MASPTLGEYTSPSIMAEMQTYSILIMMYYTIFYMLFCGGSVGRLAIN